MKRERKIQQIPFTYRGQPSCLHMDTQVAELLGQRLGDQFAAWIQRQADAIMAEQTGISWLVLHSRLKSRIVASLPDPESAPYCGINNSTSTNIPRRLLKESRL